jgi:hypothetical protein
VFDVARDERDYGLNDEQCMAAFPDFFYEIDRAVAYRRQKKLGIVQQKDVDIAWRDMEIIRVMIFQGQVCFLSLQLNLPRN